MSNQKLVIGALIVLVVVLLIWALVVTVAKSPSYKDAYLSVNTPKMVGVKLEDPLTVRERSDMDYNCYKNPQCFGYTIHYPSAPEPEYNIRANNLSKILTGTEKYDANKYLVTPKVTYKPESDATVLEKLDKMDYESAMKSCDSNDACAGFHISDNGTATLLSELPEYKHLGAASNTNNRLYQKIPLPKLGIMMKPENLSKIMKDGVSLEQLSKLGI